VEEDSKRKYISLANNVRKFFKAILPDPVAGNYKEISDLINVIADKIRSISPDVDIEEVIQKVEDLLDRSIKPKSYVISRDPRDPFASGYIDLSKFNFDELKKKFIDGRKHIEAEKLKGAINSRLKRLVRLNKLRINLLEKLNELIEEYNSGATNIEVFFDKLLVLAKELNEEEKRGISENLSEEELAVFDLLYKADLSEKEKKQVKLAAKHLLEVLKKEKFVLDWRKRQQSRATVLITIRDVLDRELPRNYTLEIYQQKCDLVYQHIYDSYYGMGKSVYSSIWGQA
jgi:type I restriction enzyme R subunit